MIHLSFPYEPFFNLFLVTLIEEGFQGVELCERGLSIMLFF